MDDGLEVQVARQDDKVTVSLTGDLDLLSRPQFQDILDDLMRALPSGATVHLDTSQLHYVDSVGIGQIVSAWGVAQRGGLTFSIVRPSYFTLRVLQVMGLDFLVDGGSTA